MSGCDGCTACCTAMRVEMEPTPKPAGERCQHCAARGCAIYETRPEPCRVWSCIWRASQDRAGMALPSAMRPDRSGVVLEINSKGYIVAHCESPDAWKREPVRRWLISQADRQIPFRPIQRVLIETVRREGVFLLRANGDLQALEFIDVDPRTNERRYKLEGVA